MKLVYHPVVETTVFLEVSSLLRLLLEVSALLALLLDVPQLEFVPQSQLLEVRSVYLVSVFHLRLDKVLTPPLFLARSDGSSAQADIRVLVLARLEWLKAPDDENGLGSRVLPTSLQEFVYKTFLGVRFGHLFGLHLLLLLILGG